MTPGSIPKTTVPTKRKMIEITKTLVRLSTRPIRAISGIRTRSLPKMIALGGVLALVGRVLSDLRHRRLAARIADRRADREALA